MPYGQIDRLRDRKAEAQKESTAILDKAEAEARDFTEDEREKLTALKANIEQTGKDLDLAVSLRENERRAFGEGPSTIVAGDDLALTKPWAEATEGLVVQHSKLRRIDIEQAKLEVGLGRQLSAIAFAQSNGRAGIENKKIFQANAVPSGGNTTIPSDGGFLVEEDYNTMLLQKSVQEAILAPKCQTIPISANSDSIELPYIDETSRATGSRWGGVRVYRRDEADTVTAAKPKFGELEIKLADIMGIAYMTGRQLQDASATGTIYANAFASEFAFKIDDEIVRGTGAGQIQGILIANATVSKAKETNQAAASIVYENILGMWNCMPSRNWTNSNWFIIQDAYVQLAQMALAVGTAGIAPRWISYDPTFGLTMMGRPAVPIEQAAALGTVGDIILADLSQFLLITKGGMQSDSSMHVRFLYDEMTFRWIQRINGGPIWQQSLSPYKGSQSRSPFVTLATRA